MTGRRGWRSNRRSLFIFCLIQFGELGGEIIKLGCNQLTHLRLGLQQGIARLLDLVKPLLVALDLGLKGLVPGPLAVDGASALDCFSPQS